MHKSVLSASLGLALALAGCAGNTMTSTPAVPSAPSVATDGHSLSAGADSARTASAVTASKVANCGDCTASFDAVDGIGGAVGALGLESAAQAPPKNPQAGVCTNGTKLFAPDRAGDPGSAEVQIFYDDACMHLSRDTVRLFNHGSKCDTVNVTVKNYALNGSWLSTRTASVQINGSVREAQSVFTVGNRKIDNSIELIVMPATGNVSAFCGDWAGYNAAGVSRTSNAEFGWEGAFDSGTRTVNSDGSVTWKGQRDTTFYEGGVGHLKIVQGKYNTSCPTNNSPAYTIGGGAAIAGTDGTTMATFYNGVLQCLFVSRTYQSGDYYVLAESHTGVSPNSPNFITGTVTHHGTIVSTFSINYLGNGTLTLKSTGCVFDVAGWTVVRS